MQNGFILQYLAIFCNRIGRLSFPRGLYKIVNSGRRKLQYLAGTLEHLYYSIWQEHWNIYIFKVVISVCLSVYMFVQSSELLDRLLSWNSVETQECSTSCLRCFKFKKWTFIDKHYFPGKTGFPIFYFDMLTYMCKIPYASFF